ncbi:hypothetical protein RUND412_008846 [Rhizina undulata]
MAVNATTSDPYAILGIPHDAAPATIRSSYKKLMLQCHPDKVHDESLRAEKALQFQKVQEAYELLTDSRRKRKYDEELARKGGKSPSSTAQEATSPGTRKSSPTSSPESPAAAAAAEERVREKERERAERHERRSRKEQERRSRGESSYGQDEREARRAYGSRTYTQEPDARSAYEPRYQEDTSRYANPKYQEDARRYESRKSPSSTTGYDQKSSTIGCDQARFSATGYDQTKSSTSYDQTKSSAGYDQTKSSAGYDQTKSSAGYDQTKSSAGYDQTKSSAGYDQTKSSAGYDHTKSSLQDSRPGYLETKLAEAAKLAALRKRMHEETSGGSGGRRKEEEPQSATAEYIRQQAAEQAKLAEAKRIEQERMKRERQEKELRERTEIPHRDRKTSTSPPLRRGSGSTVKEDNSPTTSQSRPHTHIYGSSAPSNVPYTHPINVNPYAMPRRRHSVSSPSIEKQTSRLQRDQPCDSGYSSPVPETPVTEKKMPSPIMRGAQEGIDPRTASWKKYTFEVYVREDSTTPTPPGSAPSSPHHHRRKTASTTSPSQHPAEPLTAAPPFAAEFITKATGLTGSVPYIYGSGPIDPRFTSASSTTSHVHTAPRPSHPRHHSNHHHPSPKTSPKMGSEGFSPHGQPLHPSPPTFHAHARRSDIPYGAYPPAFSRTSTY